MIRGQASLDELVEIAVEKVKEEEMVGKRGWRGGKKWSKKGLKTV